MARDDHLADVLPGHVTLLTAAGGEPLDRDGSTGLPTDLLNLSAARLQVLALLYAFIFFMAGVVPQVVIPAERASFLANVVRWAPAVIGIADAILLAAVVGAQTLMELRVGIDLAPAAGALLRMVERVDRG